MLDLNTNAIVGIVLNENRMKLVEIEPSGENLYRLTKIAEKQLNFPFNTHAIAEKAHVHDIADSLRDVIEKENFSNQNAAFSLSNNLVVVKKYPIDSGMSEEEIGDHVKWEVGQFSYSSQDDYIFDYQKLDERKNEIVVVAVKTMVVQYIRQLFSSAQIKLKYLDSDIFSAIRAINNNYEMRPGEQSALICVENSGIQFTLVEGGFYYYSYHVAFDFEKESSESALSDDIIRIISKELKRIIIDNKIGDKIEDLSRIFIYGELIKDETLRSLQNIYSVRIDRANPFRQLRFAQDVDIDKKIWSQPETFTVCVGSALR